MRVAALDVGKVRIGVAVADDLGLLAHARPFVAAQPRREALLALCGLARREELERFVLGLPLRLSGEESVEAARVRTFAQAVMMATGCEIEFWDERFSSVQAHRYLRDAGVPSRRHRALVDGVAACVLLQAWLDGRAKLS